MVGDGIFSVLLLARSRHYSVRSLERYARPRPEAVARHVARTDPAARRRHPERWRPGRPFLAVILIVVLRWIREPLRAS